MKTGYLLTVAALLVITLFSVVGVFVSGWDRPPVTAAQTGYRGLGMEVVSNPRIEGPLRARSQMPDFVPPVTAGGPPASEVYENVPVLGSLSEDEFNGLMVAITEWVSPEEGCGYCHNLENLASDEVYTKIVSRRMLEMTWHINSEWDSHVGATGVSCYTCHRGQPVPPEIWFTDPGPRQAFGIGNRAEQNAPAESVALSSLPYDPFTPFLQDDREIRVSSSTVLPAGNRRSIKQTEWTYGLMMHMSESLGVNCTYCHNTRSFFDWDASTPARATAWHGIRMARELNVKYLEPLGPTYPDERLGPLGDAPKANCATCHQGLNRPLNGVAVLDDHPWLRDEP